MAVKEVTNRDDVIDGRDLLDKWEELKGDIEALEEDIDDKETEAGDDDGDDDTLKTEIDKAQEELGILEEEFKPFDELVEEVGESTLRDGEQLINKDYFTEYAQQMAEDCCDLKEGWPHSCIDWDQAAKELQQDYSCVEFDGVTFYIRY